MVLNIAKSSDPKYRSKTVSVAIAFYFSSAVIASYHKKPFVYFATVQIVCNVKDCVSTAERTRFKFIRAHYQSVIVLDLISRHCYSPSRTSESGIPTIACIDALYDLDVLV